MADPKADPNEFRHDLIIASDDGTILHIPREVWDREEYRVNRDDYENNEGWLLVRQLLQCGVNLATVPPESLLPPGTPALLGTCYLVNIESLKRSHKFLRQA